MEFAFYYPHKAWIFDPKHPYEDLKSARQKYRIVRAKTTPNDFCRCMAIDDRYHGKRKIFIFGKTSVKELILTIVHESVHYVIDRDVGDYVSTSLDNIDDSNWLGN